MKTAFRVLSISLLSLLFFNQIIQAAPISNPPMVQSQNPNMMSVLWFQTSGEAKALYYQGYTIGKMRLDQILRAKQKSNSFKPAVVLDIDETILDNSPCLAFNVQTEKPFPANWSEWVNQAQAEALPGAIEFLKYAESKGVEIYYISNRSERMKKATIQNLKFVGAPMADARHILLKQPGEKGKEARRRYVAKTYDIVLLFGDNLGDFSGFDGLTALQRVEAVNKHQDEFGRKLIVFPNPMYGDWEEALYNYDHRKTEAEKAELRKKGLQPFQP